MNGDAFELEPDEYWGVAVPCNIELLALFSEQRWVGAKVPAPDTVRAWQAKYLAGGTARSNRSSPPRAS